VLSVGCADADTGVATAPYAAPVASPAARSAPSRQQDRQQGQQERQQQRKQQRQKQTKALFFGDSYIIGGAYTGPENSMGAIAARRLGWGYQIRGGGGTGFVSGNPEYGIPSFLGQIQEGALDVGAVDWLVIEGGGNDKYDPPKSIKRHAVRVLRAAAGKHPEARLVLVGTMDPTVDGFSDTDNVIGALARAAAKVHVPYINAQHWLEGHPDLVGPDYDHPTPAGHRLCGRKLARALRALE
jgi:lysophospholipase L1-like esterase